MNYYEKYNPTIVDATELLSSKDYEKYKSMLIFNMLYFSSLRERRIVDYLRKTLEELRKLEQ